MATEITIVMRFAWGTEPIEEDARRELEFMLDGDVISWEEEDV